ncbi:Nif3-like dinuclear metal center hexameric protein [Demequina sp.]|uniref:Nif3-like dinuclear metal center hexameric protein n=1 Tax=Demequina sp. TaxID=2050685 RepID=UPI003D10D1D7
MPTVRDALDALERRFPARLAEEWDVNGLTVGSRDAKITRAHFAVDPTLAVAREAVAAGAELLITHHPLMLRGVSNVAADTAKGAVVHALVQGGTALANAHTNADHAAGGVADALARAVGLEVTGPLVSVAGEAALGTGRVGTLGDGPTLRDFAQRVASALPTTAHGVRVAGDLDAPVRTVAVVGGAGDAFLDDARAAGVDVYVTADLRHHPALDARELAGLGDGRPYLVDVSHFASEWLWLADAAAYLADELGVDTFVSTVNTDPWTARFDAS